jgi:hypothetical protein
MLTLQCQRWRDRRGSYVPAGEPIDPRDFTVDVLEEARARPFVAQHHYSGTYPAARLAVGLFRRRELVGAAVFSVGMQDAAIPKWTGVDSHQGCELGRLVLLDDVAANGESWFLARAFRALRAEKPELEAVLSYADPVSRRDAAGAIVKPGHVGTIYQALGARYRGRASKRTDYFTRCGRHVSRRALSKIRLDEVGAGYAADQLVALGLERQAGEDGLAWIVRLESTGELVKARHPGNHTYAFALTPAAKSAGAALDEHPYPKLFLNRD